jgi:hypothetical protein
MMDYWDRISSREPLTHGFHASEVSLIIDFKNYCFAQFEAMQHFD